jgi:hypothetical protein
MTHNAFASNENTINYSNLNKIKEEIKKSLLYNAVLFEDIKVIENAIELIGEDNITPGLASKINRIKLENGILRVSNNNQSLAYFYNSSGDFNKMRNGNFVSKKDDFPNILLRYRETEKDKDTKDDSHNIIIHVTDDFHISFFRNYNRGQIIADKNIYGNINSRLHLTIKNGQRLYLGGNELDFLLESEKIAGLFNRIEHYIKNGTSYNDNTPLNQVHLSFFNSIPDKRLVMENIEKLKHMLYFPIAGGNSRKNSNIKKIEKMQKTINLLKKKIQKNKETINKLMRKKAKK